MTSIVLHLSAGQGPKECEWVVTQTLKAFQKEAVSGGLTCRPLERMDETMPSILIEVSGEDSAAFVAERLGTIRWIGQSPYRPRHKRKNWFISVTRAPEESAVPELKDRDITFQAMRASGPGGQHVNKTDSAVRATHRPTGLTTISQDQRSQFANKKIARLKLRLLLAEKEHRSEAAKKDTLWQQTLAIERGNEVRCYEGPRFKWRRRETPP